MCESNPALHRLCSVLWLSGWSSTTMQQVPRMVLSRAAESASGKRGGSHRRRSTSDALVSGFETIHSQAPEHLKTPRRYMAFIHMYQRLYKSKKDDIVQRCQRLEAGVSKLTEAQEVVAALKAEAADQEQLLAEKQEKANAALQMITDTMRDANTHKTEMESLKDHTERENVLILQRKKAIDEELAEVEPLIKEASAAVGNIKSESLSEIRSMRAPPDVIRDILEGVLRLMGIQDTSWNSMKTFLAKRGVKEDIRSFDARRIAAESRAAVERLLQERGESFEARTAKRASVAAAPLAAWVTANVRFSRVLEKIRPLEREQQLLQKNLSAAQEQVRQLSTGLSDVDNTVAELKKQLNSSTKEAAEIEIRLTQAQSTITAAEGLVSKLNDEYRRWKAQLAEFSQALQRLPVNGLLAAAFLAYLPAAPEDERAECLRVWSRLLGNSSSPQHQPPVRQPPPSSDSEDNDEDASAAPSHHVVGSLHHGGDFMLTQFLGSEQQLLQWQAEGLPSDQLSQQNALIILKITSMEAGTCLRPLLVDPTSLASEWLKSHLQHLPMDVVTQHSERFPTALELAIRFGKVLIVQEVDTIDPILFPVLRGDFISQGPRKVVQLGDKLIDYNDSFQLFMTTRNPEPGLSPDSIAVITCVNFTTTWAGLTGQLLAAALRQERPELEARRRELLRREDEQRMRLDELQEGLLQELASAQGDILANTELLESLNRSKVSGAEVAAALRESGALRAEAAAECNTFQPLAEFGATLFFALADLVKLGSTYRFSVAAFSRLFQKALSGSNETPLERATEVAEAQEQAQHRRLLLLTYQYASRALFKADRLTLALHLVRRMHPEQVPDAEWALFTRQAAPGARLDMTRVDDSLPSWVPEERAYDLHLLKTALPALVQELGLEDAAAWSAFAASSESETAFPVHLRSLSIFQRALAVQALRPDRLHTTLMNMALQALGLQELSPPGISLRQLLEETLPEEPILLMLSAGADPGEELRAMALTTIGAARFHEVALGQGQAELALDRLTLAARDGFWLYLTNLHLVTGWLPTLEKYLRDLQPHPDFRLWITAEPHPHFPPVLAETCLKVTYEAPQGVRRNLQRTFSTWGTEVFSSGSGVRGEQATLRAKALFALAWFHAVLQERRTFIPQGWAKFYEFSDGDLRAATELLQRLFERGSPKWEFIQGLCENAIYGGRVDNPFDLRVLASYTREFFNTDVLALGRRPLGPGINLPPSSNYRDYITIIHQLSDKDKPSYFGLPANVERSWQRIRSNEVISQLRILQRPTEQTLQFDRQEWQTQLSPIMSLWRKLNQGSSLLQGKVPEAEMQAKDEAPIAQFLRLELQGTLALMQRVHRSLAALSRVIRGSTLPSRESQLIANDLMRQQTPEVWLRLWEGPNDPLLYVRSLTARATAVVRWNERGANQVLRETCDLAELFHPDTFLSALKQQTARELAVALDELVLASSWTRAGISGAHLPVTLIGLQLEGAQFDGQRLQQNSSDSLSVITALPCTVAWLPKGRPQVYLSDKKISIPLYFTAERERVIVTLDVPCPSDHAKWLQVNAAFFLKN